MTLKTHPASFWFPNLQGEGVSEKTAKSTFCRVKMFEQYLVRMVTVSYQANQTEHRSKFFKQRDNENQKRSYNE